MLGCQPKDGSSILLARLGVLASKVVNKMARISLIICDLCKIQMTEEESRQDNCVTLLSLGEEKQTGEICPKCFKSLMHRLTSVEKPVVVTKSPAQSAPLLDQKSLSKAEINLEGAQTEVQPPGVTVIKQNIEGRESSDQLHDDEMNIVPSLFDKRKARKALREMNGGSNCLHHFTSFRNGKIICSPAPPGIEGEHAGFRGCGEIVPAKHYTTSKPRHFTFKTA